MCQVIKNFKLDVESNRSVLFKKNVPEPLIKRQSFSDRRSMMSGWGKKSFMMESHQILADHCGIEFDKFDPKSFKCLSYINGST